MVGEGDDANLVVVLDEHDGVSVAGRGDAPQGPQHPARARWPAPHDRRPAVSSARPARPSRRSPSLRSPLRSAAPLRQPTPQLRARTRRASAGTQRGAHLRVNLGGVDSIAPRTNVRDAARDLARPLVGRIDVVRRVIEAGDQRREEAASFRSRALQRFVEQLLGRAHGLIVASGSSVGEPRSGTLTATPASPRAPRAGSAARCRRRGAA